MCEDDVELQDNLPRGFIRGKKGRFCSPVGGEKRGIEVQIVVGLLEEIDRVAEASGFSRSTLIHRLIVAALPAEKELLFGQAVATGVPQASVQPVWSYRKRGAVKFSF
mgnify:CR=1 FL=1